MAKTLNDTQRLILSAAAAREGRRALPPPGTLRAPPHVVKKSLTAMIEADLLAEITALPDDEAWTESAAGGRVTLVATPQGLAAIDIEAATSPTGPRPSIKGAAGATSPGKLDKGAARASMREAGAKQSKQDLVLALLRRPEGASLPEMCEVTGWQPHSVRGFMSGALKKRLGLEVTSTKGAGGDRRYHVPPLKQVD